MRTHPIPPASQRSPRTFLRIGIGSLLLLAGTLGCSEAGLSSYEAPADAIPTEGVPSSDAFVIVPADSILYHLELHSRKKDPIAQLDALLTARDRLEAETKKLAGFVRLETGEPRFGIWKKASGAWQNPEVNAMRVALYLEVPEDLLVQSRDLLNAVAAVSGEGDAEVDLRLLGRQAFLANPEQHRPALLEKLAKSLESARSLPASKSILGIDGMEKPLAVSPHGQTAFIVSLPYTLTVEAISEKAPSAADQAEPATE